MKILIKNGTIVDGTGSKGYKSDLLTDGDEIVETGENLSAEGAEIFSSSSFLPCSWICIFLKFFSAIFPVLYH